MERANSMRPSVNTSAANLMTSRYIVSTRKGYKPEQVPENGVTIHTSMLKVNSSGTISANDYLKLLPHDHESPIIVHEHEPCRTTCWCMSPLELPLEDRTFHTRSWSKALPSLLRSHFQSCCAGSLHLHERAQHRRDRRQTMHRQ